MVPIIPVSHFQSPPTVLYSDYECDCICDTDRHPIIRPNWNEFVNVVCWLFANLLSCPIGPWHGIIVRELELTNATLISEPPPAKSWCPSVRKANKTTFSTISCPYGNIINFHTRVEYISRRTIRQSAHSNQWMSVRTHTHTDRQTKVKTVYPLSILISDPTIRQYAHSLLLESPFVPSSSNCWAVRVKIRPKRPSQWRWRRSRK